MAEVKKKKPSTTKPAPWPDIIKVKEAALRRYAQLNPAKPKPVEQIIPKHFKDMGDYIVLEPSEDERIKNWMRGRQEGVPIQQAVTTPVKKKK